MSERPIFLDARDLAGRAFAEQRQDDAGRSGGLSSGTPSDQDQSRFRQAVSAGAQSLEPAAAERNESDAIASRPASAFELFGRVSETVDRRGESGQASLKPLCATIDRFVRRMTLSDGQDGRRGLNIDLDLEGDAIPGVTVSVLRDAGAWLAEFQCRQPESYRLLAGSAVEMAAKLAQALQSDAVWRVLAQEGIAPSDWSDLDGLCDDRGTVEAFCSAPMGRDR
jgi:hypothetical protein